LASLLKNSTLSLLNEIVTFTLSSFKTNKFGGGRKSLMLFVLPKGSFVYFIWLFITIRAYHIFHDSPSLAVLNGIVLWGAADETGTGYCVPLAYESDIRSV
jgi:hypothetical protein